MATVFIEHLPMLTSNAFCSKVEKLSKPICLCIAESVLKFCRIHSDTSFYQFEHYKDKIIKFVGENISQLGLKLTQANNDKSLLLLQLNKMVNESRDFDEVFYDRFYFH